MDRLADTISLSLPTGPRYAGVARIVIGGLAARLNLSYESLDDLQLAVETVLADDRLLGGGQVDLELEVLEGMLVVTIGPIDVGATRAQLDGDGNLPLRTVLAAVVDEALVDEATASLRLHKDVPTLQGD